MLRTEKCLGQPELTMLVYGIANEFCTAMIKLAIHPCQTKQPVYRGDHNSESRISDSLLYLYVRYIIIPCSAVIVKTTCTLIIIINKLALSFLAYSDIFLNWSYCCPLSNPDVSGDPGCWSLHWCPHCGGSEQVQEV